VNLPSGIRPMLATSGVMPTQDGWQYEIKWDGVRALTYVDSGRVIRMESRNLKDFTPRYPEVCQASAVPEALRGRSLVLDGEVVGFDERGRVSFGALQHRMHLSTERAARQKRDSHPVAYMVFDLLWLDGSDLTSQPVEERRAALVDLGISSGLWQVPPVVAGSMAEGEALREASWPSAWVRPTRSAGGAGTG
jgi:bifunctional non-homologous end joining protein LigD